MRFTSLRLTAGRGVLCLPLLALCVACWHGAPPAASASPPAIDPLRPFTGEERDRIERVQGIVAAAADQHGVSAMWINGVIWVESKFKRRARGRRGPRGLMQIMPRTGRSIARTLGRRYRPLSADFNIHAGAYYLSKMFARFPGDPVWGLAAYNHGPGIVRRWQRDATPPSARSQRYAARVKQAAHAIARMFRPRLGQERLSSSPASSK